MKTLLFLNGPEGCQMGIEDGFSYLQYTGEISDLKWFYFNAFTINDNSSDCLSKMIDVASNFRPQLIVFFHIGNFPITNEFLVKLRQLPSKPIIVYDEGDMYGGWVKPLTRSMKSILKHADIVSIRGLGKWYESVKKYNSNIIYTPHSNSLLRQTKNLIPTEFKKDKLIFIGNKVTSRLGRVFRLPGAWGRENLVNYLSNYFSGKLKLYGNGWNDYSGNMGILEFNNQVKICASSLIQVSYEHYPNIPYYFSDRLPIALASGQIYVCHYHNGYENIFHGCDFIYFFKTTKESIDIINYILSLDSKELNEKSIRAKIFADKFLSPEIVWGNFYRAITNKDHFENENQIPENIRINNSSSIKSSNR